MTYFHLSLIDDIIIVVIVAVTVNKRTDMLSHKCYSGTLHSAYDKCIRGVDVKVAIRQANVNLDTSVH